MPLLTHLRAILDGRNRLVSWRRFAMTFLAVFGCGAAGLYAFVLLLDPYNVVPFSLPIERPLVSINQRYMYPQVARSGRFDSFIIGTSTSRLIDPKILNEELGARFANLGMDSATAWEQKTLAQYFIRNSGPPKIMIIDASWFDEHADRNRITFRGFPDFLYDDDRWNDLLYLMNSRTVEVSGRLVGYHLGLYGKRSRYDGYQVFVPPDETYDAAKAQAHIWGSRPHVLPDANAAPYFLSPARRAGLKFPALGWLDELFAAAPNTIKVVAFMPVHVAAQSSITSEAGAIEAEYKARVVDIARRRGAMVVDWRIPSALTTNDNNYWDSLHYRVPVAQRLSRDLAQVIRDGRASPDNTYRVLLNQQKTADR